MLNRWNRKFGSFHILWCCLLGDHQFLSLSFKGFNCSQEELLKNCGIKKLYVNFSQKSTYRHVVKINNSNVFFSFTHALTQKTKSMDFLSFNCLLSKNIFIFLCFCHQNLTFITDVSLISDTVNFHSQLWNSCAAWNNC